MAAYAYSTCVLKKAPQFQLHLATTHACIDVLSFSDFESAGFSGPSHLNLGDFEMPASREGSTAHKMGNAQSEGGVVITC